MKLQTSSSSVSSSPSSSVSTSLSLSITEKDVIKASNSLCRSNISSGNSGTVVYSNKGRGGGGGGAGAAKISPVHWSDIGGLDRYVY